MSKSEPEVSLSVHRHMRNLETAGRSFKVRIVAHGLDQVFEPLAHSETIFLGKRRGSGSNRAVFVNLANVTLIEVLED
ncbi:hypothetical protein [Aureimonas sp. AU40]|uniref:hypothetical protein n=1 Tax=Aureimonas sp. AU40 TaxID=1637747 RepID=UPI0007815428|nr:hypothetical protein [Aureimonas sp. AU40]